LQVRREKNASQLAFAFATGALSFWSPVIIARLVLGEDWGALLTVVPLTLVLPVLACLALDLMAQRWTAPRPGLALAMIVGIWASGPFFMMLANTFTPGEGFHQADAWSFVGLGTALFPVYTFMMATYEGSLFAVLFTTIGLLVFSFADWNFGRWTRCSLRRL
jgi:hypothetical protein